MASFLGFGNYDKAGPGIEKNAPKKKGIVVFFETFQRNFWKFIPINLVYILFSIFLIPSGLASVGITNVTRNIARDRHSFGMSDFFETIKKNWKQALPIGILNVIAYALIFFDMYFFYNAQNDTMASIGIGVSLSLYFVLSVMNYYVWTLIITFNYSLKQIIKNSFKFVFINVKGNVICFLLLTLCYALNIFVAYILPSVRVEVITLEVVLYVILYPCFRYLLAQYFTFPAIKKNIIDPYYAEHPDDDIELRRDFGLIEETDDEEEESEEDEESDDEEASGESSTED